MNRPPSSSRSVGSLAVLALAYAGGVVAYLPLLSFLLPIHVAAIAKGERIDLLTAIVVAGTITSSIANILFGALSDGSVARGGGRRRWIALGIAVTASGYVVIAGSATSSMLVLGVMLFQLGVNAILAPLFAILADEVPDAQKATAGALLSLGAPIASGVAALVMALPDTTAHIRYAMVVLTMTAMLTPLLLQRVRPTRTSSALPRAMRRRYLILAWGSRLAVQVAGNALSLYLLYYFQTVVPDMSLDGLGKRVGQVLTLSLLAAVPVALLAGRFSDRAGHRKALLILSALAAALGLVTMAVARDFEAAATAFALYSVGSAVFLALHSGFAMLILPSPRHRGRDLGLVNLANTLPALGGPLLTWALATPDDFSLVLIAMAGLTAMGGAMILMIRPV